MLEKLAVPALLLATSAQIMGYPLNPDISRHNNPLSTYNLQSANQQSSPLEQSCTISPDEVKKLIPFSYGRKVAEMYVSSVANISTRQRIGNRIFDIVIPETEVYRVVGYDFEASEQANNPELYFSDKGLALLDAVEIFVRGSEERLGVIFRNKSAESDNEKFLAYSDLGVRENGGNQIVGCNSSLTHGFISQIVDSIHGVTVARRWRQQQPKVPVGGKVAAWYFPADRERV